MQLQQFSCTEPAGAKHRFALLVHFAFLLLAAARTREIERRALVLEVAAWQPVAA